MGVAAVSCRRREVAVSLYLQGENTEGSQVDRRTEAGQQTGEHDVKF